MGRVLSAMIPEAELSGGSSARTSDEELRQIISRSDVLIDFSTPISSLKALGVAAEYGVPAVVGTTGFSEAEFERIKVFSESTAILYSSNFSPGIQLMALLVEKCSRVLTEAEFDFSVIDRHHRNKKDAPSGTALFLAESAARKAEIVSLREGSIPGEHTCSFTGKDEMLSITHRAFNREVFAVGALKCASRIRGKDPKLYSMRDFLGDILS
jgi:4-hydroxy-tetrahydrodipicolinate reductase